MHTFIFRWNYGLHCLLNISINFHTLPLCLINLSFASGVDPFQASMVQWSLETWKIWAWHINNLNQSRVSLPRTVFRLWKPQVYSLHLGTLWEQFRSELVLCISRVFPSSSLSASMGNAHRTAASTCWKPWCAHWLGPSGAMVHWKKWPFPWGGGIGPWLRI